MSATDDDDEQLQKLRMQSEAAATHGATMTNVLVTIVGRLGRIEQSLGPMLMSEKQIAKMKEKKAAKLSQHSHKAPSMQRSTTSAPVQASMPRSPARSQEPPTAAPSKAVAAARAPASSTPATSASQGTPKPANEETASTSSTGPPSSTAASKTGPSAAPATANAPGNSAESNAANQATNSPRVSESESPASKAATEAPASVAETAQSTDATKADTATADKAESSVDKAESSVDKAESQATPASSSSSNSGSASSGTEPSSGSSSGNSLSASSPQQASTQEDVEASSTTTRTLTPSGSAKPNTATDEHHDAIEREIPLPETDEQVVEADGSDEGHDSFVDEYEAGAAAAASGAGEVSMHRSQTAPVSSGADEASGNVPGISMPGFGNLKNAVAKRMIAAGRRARLRAQHGEALIERIVELEMSAESSQPKIDRIDSVGQDAARGLVTALAAQKDASAALAILNDPKVKAARDKAEQMRQELLARLKASEAQVAEAMGVVKAWKAKALNMSDALEAERSRGRRTEAALAELSTKVAMMWQAGGGLSGAASTPAVATAALFGENGPHAGVVLEVENTVSEPVAGSTKAGRVPSAADSAKRAQQWAEDEMAAVESIHGAAFLPSTVAFKTGDVDSAAAEPSSEEPTRLPSELKPAEAAAIVSASVGGRSGAAANSELQSYAAGCGLWRAPVAGGTGGGNSVAAMAWTKASADSAQIAVAAAETAAAATLQRLNARSERPSELGETPDNGDDDDAGDFSAASVAATGGRTESKDETDLVSTALDDQSGNQSQHPRACNKEQAALEARTGVLRAHTRTFRSRSLFVREHARNSLVRLKAVVRAALGEWPVDDIGALPDGAVLKRSFGAAVAAGVTPAVFAGWASEEKKQRSLKEALDAAVQAISAAVGSGPLLWGSPGAGSTDGASVQEGWWRSDESGRRMDLLMALPPAGDTASDASKALHLPDAGSSALSAAVEHDLFEPSMLAGQLRAVSGAVAKCLALAWPSAVLSRAERSRRVQMAAAARVEAAARGVQGGQLEAVTQALLPPPAPPVLIAAVRRELQRALMPTGIAAAACLATASCQSALAASALHATETAANRLARAIDTSSTLLLGATEDASAAGEDRDRRLTILEATVSGLSDATRVDGMEAKMRELQFAMDQAKEGLSSVQADVMDRASRKEMAEALRLITEGLKEGVDATELRARLGKLANLVDAKADESALLHLQAALKAALDRISELQSGGDDGSIEALLSTRKCMSCGRALPPDAQDLENAAQTRRNEIPQGAQRRKPRGQYNRKFAASGAAPLPGSVSGMGRIPTGSGQPVRNTYGNKRRGRGDFMTTTQARSKGRNPLFQSTGGLPSVSGAGFMQSAGAFNGAPGHTQPGGGGGGMYATAGADLGGASGARGGRGRRASGGDMVWPPANAVGVTVGTTTSPPAAATSGAGRPLEGWATQSAATLPRGAPPASVAESTSAELPPGSSKAFFTSAQRSSGEYFAQFTVAGSKRLGGAGGAVKGKTGHAEGGGGGDSWLGLNPVRRTADAMGSNSASIPAASASSATGSHESAMDSIAGSRLAGPSAGSVASLGDSPVGRKQTARPALTERAQAEATRAKAFDDGAAAMGTASPPQVTMPSAYQSPKRTTAAELRKQAGEELSVG